MAAETPPIHEQIIPPSEQPDEYDQTKGEELADWVFELLGHAASMRKKITREDKWDSDFAFLKGSQWTGPLPSYRRPIKMNAWARALHIALSIVIGNRPILKLIPQGTNVDSNVMKAWQDAFWSIQKTEYVIDKYAEALTWAWIGDGGFFKVGYGRRHEYSKSLADVMISSPHPKKIYPDPDCTDFRLIDCSYIIFRDVLDMATMSARYPEQAHLVEPDGSVSRKWSTESPEWAKSEGDVISPAGGWRATGDYSRAKATVAECWIDDSSLETKEETQITNIKQMIDTWSELTGMMNGSLSPEDRSDLQGNIEGLSEQSPIEKVNQLRERMMGLTSRDITPELRRKKVWAPRYPYGRIITCTRNVVLRDIPNEAFGRAFGYEMRWPFVYIPGALYPNTLWRPGLLADNEEIQRSINKALSLLIENSIKVTNALVICDENAMEDEDWDNLSLVPGCKIRKRPMSEFKVEFPKPLPPQAFQLPDYLIRKLEEQVGLHDPPIAPGQSVASKTVAFMQQKGSFLMGMLAKLAEESLERLGARMIGLMVDRYLPGRMVPMFDGEKISGVQQLPELPPSLRFRVEATSGFQEVLGFMEMMSQQGKPQSRRQQRNG